VTTTEATPPTPPPSTETKPLHYRYSVLITAIGRFFRGFIPFAAVIVFNAIVQMVLIWIFDPLPGWNAPFIITTVISFVVLLWAFHALNVTALAVATGKTDVSTVAKSGKNWLTFSLWSVAVYFLVLLGMIVNSWLPLVVLAILPFVPMAAADGKRNPIVTNFKVIGERWLRYVITAIILGALLVFSTLMSAVNGFFIGGNLGSVIVWLFWGVTAAWYLNALALIYRSTNTGAENEQSSNAKATE
jgi:hypothetical protein